MSAVARLRAWRVPSALGPVMLLLLSLAGIATVLYGEFFGVNVEIEQFDAGTVDRFAIHRVVAFPEKALYVVGLEDGRIRAIDGRVEASGCRVNWLPDDPRGAVRNPGARPGVFEDPCTGALWSFEGNAIAGAEEPLRTPHIAPVRQADGRDHITVELINPSD